MNFKAIEFRHFFDLKTKKKIIVRVRFLSDSEIFIYPVKGYNSKRSLLLENYFNYPENKNIFDYLKEGYEVKLSLIEKISSTGKTYEGKLEK